MRHNLNFEAGFLLVFVLSLVVVGFGKLSAQDRLGSKLEPGEVDMPVSDYFLSLDWNQLRI